MSAKVSARDIDGESDGDGVASVANAGEATVNPKVIANTSIDFLSFILEG